MSGELTLEHATYNWPWEKQSLRRSMFSSTQAPGLSYYHNPGTEPLQYLTIGQLTSQAAARWPDTDVLVSVQEQTRLTFSQAEQQGFLILAPLSRCCLKSYKGLFDAVYPAELVKDAEEGIKASQLAAGFLELGLVPGDRVGICSPNSTQWVLTALAAAKAGLILVTLNPAYLSHELEYCLQKVAVRALVTDESYKTQQYYQMLCDIVPQLSTRPPNTTVTCSKLPHFSFIIVNSEKNFPGTFRFCDIRTSTDSLKLLNEAEERLKPEKIANMLFTSGTTGKPKAVPGSHFNLVNNSYCVGKRLGLDKKHHKILAQTPLFHALGYVCTLMTGLKFGATMILPSSPTFNVVSSAEAIQKEKCTMLLGTPTMYVDLCSHVGSLSPEEQLLHQSPEFAISGGALCLPELFLQIKNTFSCERVVSVYGMTETTITFQSEAHDSQYLMTSTVGKVSEHVEARVVDSEGQTVPLGTPGELWIRSFNNMAGYWDDQKITDSMKTPDRWLKTGDKFVLLEGGYGQVVGRHKDMIIRGGENISPKDVEECLLSHPDILDVQVFGVTDERMGEEVGCSLRLKPDSGVTITRQQVRDFCKGKIAHFKIPKYVEVVDEYPKTGSGKIQKFKIRAAMEERLGLIKSYK